MPRSPVAPASTRSYGSEDQRPARWTSHRTWHGSSRPMPHPPLYQAAGMRPADIDVAQLHDAYSHLVLAQLEDFELCEAGEAAAFVRDGQTGASGRMPVNLNGGLLFEASCTASTTCSNPFDSSVETGPRRWPIQRWRCARGSAAASAVPQSWYGPEKVWHGHSPTHLSNRQPCPINCFKRLTWVLRTGQAESQPSDCLGSRITREPGRTSFEEIR